MLDFLSVFILNSSKAISKKMREVEGGVLDSTLVAVETLSKEVYWLFKYLI